jgi:excisionase family DNA binding protein
MLENTLPIRDAASILGVSETQVRRLIESNKLKLCKGVKPQSVYKDDVLLMKSDRGHKQHPCLSIPQLASKLGVSTDWVRSQIKQKYIDAKLLGRQYCIPEREVERLLT